MVQQLAAAVHPLLVGEEKLQQAVLGWPHLHRGALNAHPVADRVQHQLTGFYRVAAGEGVGAAQYGFKARHQLAGEKGLVM